MSFYVGLARLGIEVSLVEIRLLMKIGSFFCLFICVLNIFNVYLSYQINQ